ncbi:MAG: hypothetical protein KA206_06875 [Paludibacter sp.]|nr:hypothetical protein [Paludibacter sp.]
MKALNFTPIITAAILFFAVSFAKAQTPVHCCTVIEVTDGYYTDKVWMITEPGTTDGFDNGWDGYKFINTTAGIPQIFDKTVDGDFQVSSFPSIENKNIGFLAGKATDYTFKFIHYDITYFYKGLFLVDLLTGDTIDVYANLSTYKFKASKTDVATRFKFVTKKSEKPVVVVPPVVTPSESTSKNYTIKNKVKVFSSRRMLKVENPYKIEMTVKVVDARTGKLLGTYIVNSKSTVSIGDEEYSGPVIVETSAGAESTTTKVLVQ